MDKLYKAYIKLNPNRRVLAEAEIPLQRAVDFLNENPKNGVIMLDQREIKLEELQNAENFRSDDRSRFDNTVETEEPVSEDSDRQLFESFIDNPE